MGQSREQIDFSSFDSQLQKKKSQLHHILKMSETEAKDAFIIFDEAYEGNDVDAVYLGDILRALGCNVTKKSSRSRRNRRLGREAHRFRRLSSRSRGCQSRYLRHRMQGGLYRGVEGLR